MPDKGLKLVYGTAVGLGVILWTIAKFSSNLVSYRYKVTEKENTKEFIQKSQQKPQKNIEDLVDVKYYNGVSNEDSLMSKGIDGTLVYTNNNNLIPGQRIQIIKNKISETLHDSLSNRIQKVR